VSGGSVRPKVSVETFRDDPMFPLIERAVLAILAEGPTVTPIEVMVRIGWLSRQNLEVWRQGRVRSLESVIQCNMTCLGRFLQILSVACHDLNLIGTPGKPRQRAGGRAIPLRFTVSGDPRIEAAYARQYVWPGKRPFHLPEQYSRTQAARQKTLRHLQDLQLPAAIPMLPDDDVPDLGVEKGLGEG